MVVQLQTLLLTVIVGQDVLTLSIGMVATAILVLLMVNRGGHRTGAFRACLRTVGRVGVVIVSSGSGLRLDL